MGCDIHVFVEVKSAGKWILVGTPNVDRNYYLFGLMAGVRDSETPFHFEPRGLPSDISEGTALYYKQWEPDAHTESWLSSAELSKVIKHMLKQDYIRKDEWKWISENFGYVFGNYIHEFDLYRESYPDFITDVRVVFWFDN